MFDSDWDEMVLLASCCHGTCNCINRNTHDGDENAKCLVSGTSYNGMNEIGSVTYNVSQLFIV